MNNYNKLQIKRAFITLLTSLSLSTYSQKSNEIVDYIPMTPESYVFKKKFNTEVSTFTGALNLDIPIYSIKVEDIEIPISISYNSGGIKVEEESSIVGLGWMLNIGGEISRKNNGAPDERSFLTTNYNSLNGIGTLKQPIVFLNLLDYTTKFFAKAYKFSEAIDHSNPYLNYQVTKDFRPDEFFYSFLGNSGSFMFNQSNSSFINFPLNDIKFNYSTNYVQGSGNVFHQLTAKMTNGSQIIFGEDGRRSVRLIAGPFFDNSWQIKRIVTQTNQTIEYEYIQANYNTCTRSVWTGYVGHTYSPALPESTSTANCNEYQNNESLIKRIIFPNGEIIFNYENRDDLMTGSKRLTEILVYSNQTLIKRIKFNQSYFASTQTTYTTPNYQVSNLTRTKRLKLDSVEFYGNNETVKENYLFEYNVFDKVPTKDSFARDNWGFFNGNFLQPLKPKIFTPNCLVDCYPKVHPTYSKTFTLKKITYPDGGHTTYDYENNRIDVTQNSAPMHLIHQLTDELYETVWQSLSISGYQLNNYNPVPTPDVLYPNQRKFLYGEPFELTAEEASAIGTTGNNFFVNSNLPFQLPNYNNFLAAYNYVTCGLEKFNGTSYVATNVSKTISKDQNSSGNYSDLTILTAGTYRFKIELYQGYLNSSGGSSLNLNFSHSTSISLKIRKRVTDEILVGGLRISEVNSYTPNHAYKTKYKYLLDNGKSSGKIIHIPSFYDYVSSLVFSNENHAHYTHHRFSSEPIAPLVKTKGSDIGYIKVIKEEYNIENNSEFMKTEYNYSFSNSMFSDYIPNNHLIAFEPNRWESGKLLSKVEYSGGNYAKIEEYDYYGFDLEYNMGYVEEINTDFLDKNEMLILPPGAPAKRLPMNSTGIGVSKYQADVNHSIPNSTNTIFPFFKQYTGFDKIKSTKIKNFLNGAIVESTEEYFYNNIPQSVNLSSKISTNSTNEISEAKYYYSNDLEMANEPYVNEMINKNMIEIPLKIETLKNNQLLSTTETTYKDWGNGLLAPELVKVAKGEGDLEIRLRYDHLDTVTGNPLELQQENGTLISYIWGYNNTKPVAKIENIAYSNVPSNLIAAIQSATTESAMLTALTNLRNDPAFDNAMLTTYTYIPLVGIKTMTDPKGYTMTYHYDSFNRLEKVTDMQCNILSENEYHYRTQN